jgi:hypothetical protein
MLAQILVKGSKIIEARDDSWVFQAKGFLPDR